MGLIEDHTAGRKEILIYSVFNESTTKNLIQTYESTEENLRKNNSDLEEEIKSSIEKGNVFILEGFINNIIRTNVKGKPFLVPNTSNIRNKLNFFFRELNTRPEQNQKIGEDSKGLNTEYQEDKYKILEEVIRNTMTSLSFIGTDKYFTKISFNLDNIIIKKEPVVINLKYHHTKDSRAYLLDYIISLENKVLDSLTRAEREKNRTTVGVIYNPRIDEYEVGYMRIEESIPSLSEYIMRKYVFETGITGTKPDFRKRYKKKPKKKNRGQENKLF